MIKKIALVTFALYVALSAGAQTKIIAHRGYWDCAGSAQNSLTSLKAADRIGVYGSEFDVHLIQDNQIVVYHDNAIKKVPIQTASYATLRKYKLKNGETIPTLNQYLETAKSLKTKLILEIKTQYSTNHEDSLVKETVALVKAMGMEQRVEYISFSKNACLKLRQLCPDARISYLNGDWNPWTIKKNGLTGIDYENKVLAEHPEWIKQCHDLGLTVNVWTVNDLNDINDFIKAGVDFITTNKPVEAMKLAR